jgi:uncharacterized protein (DUF2236 family)
VDQLFARDSVAREIARRPTVMAVAGSRAILMQLAHPKVAAGIDEHSDFRADPVGRILRTALAFRSFIFHSKKEASKAAERVSRIHDRVRGTDYVANDPALLLWVHATTVTSMIGAYCQLVRELDRYEQERFYEEAKVIAELLGCPREYQPADLTAMEDYIESMVEMLEPTDAGRQLVRELLFVPLRLWGRPMMWMYRLYIVGSLPVRLRDELHIRWPWWSATLWRIRKLIRAPLIGSRTLARATFRRPSPAKGRCRDCRKWSPKLTIQGRCPSCGFAHGDALLERVERFSRLIGLQARDDGTRVA